MTDDHKMKNILQSKTFWLNLIAALVAFLPAVKDWLAANPETALSALAAANVLVRFVTSGKVSLFGSEEPKPGTDSGMFPCWLVWIAAAGLLCVGLPSCSTTVTKTIMPDGAIVEVTAKSADPVAIKGACDLADKVLPLLDDLARQQGGVANTRINQTDPPLIP